MTWFKSAEAGVFLHALVSFGASVLAGLPTILPLLFATQPMIDAPTQALLIALANVLANATTSQLRNQGTITVPKAAG